jgi:peroxiredoxin (alkyl hydroperoxide reductase subunit C)
MENTNYNEDLHRQIVGMTEPFMQERMLSIGMKAPDFIADTTFGVAKMSDYTGKWVIFFSHPGDFTPVCTTEFIAFAKYYPEFVKRNANLLGLSIDSNASHLAWVYNIYKMTGIQIPFPVVADRNMAIAKMYGMMPADQNVTQTVRNVFIIDPEQKIRAILQYPMTNGRNIPEILRLLDALQTTDSENVVTPANWMPGQPVIVPYPKTYDELLERVKNPSGYSCMDWYLCYKKGSEYIQPMVEPQQMFTSPIGNMMPQSNVNMYQNGYMNQ